MRSYLSISTEYYSIYKFVNHVAIAVKHPDAALRYLLRRYLFLGSQLMKIERAFLPDLLKGDFITHLNKKLRGSILEKKGLFVQDVMKMRQVETYVLCRMLKPKVVVETGVEMGISTSFILKALEDNNLGQLYSIEICRFLPNGEEVGYIVPTELRHRWKLIIGHSLKVLPALCRQVYPIDIFIHDSEHTYQTMFAEYSIAWPYIGIGKILLSDDTGRNEAFIHFSKKVGVAPSWTPRGYGILWKS